MSINGKQLVKAIFVSAACAPWTRRLGGVESIFDALLTRSIQATRKLLVNNVSNICFSSLCSLEICTLSTFYISPSWCFHIAPGCSWPNMCQISVSAACVPWRFALCHPADVWGNDWRKWKLVFRSSSRQVLEFLGNEAEKILIDQAASIRAMTVSTKRRFCRKNWFQIEFNG